MNRYRLFIMMLCLYCGARLASAAVLTLSDAEQKAATTGFEMRIEHFEERSKEWEKRNAIASYLPSLDYSFDYTQMDEEMVDRSNESFKQFESFADIGNLIFDMIPGLDSATRQKIYTDYADMMLAAAGGQAASGQSSGFESAMLYPTTFKHAITVTQPITNGGVEIIAIGIARDTKRAIELQIEAMRQEVIYNTRKAYFNALAAVEQTAMAYQDLSWTKQNLINAQTRQESGAIPMTDLLQWEAEVAQKESNVLLAEAAQRFALLSLFQAMGIQAHKADTAVRLEPLETFEQQYRSGVSLKEGSVDDNPQLQSIRLLTKVAGGSKRVAVSQFMPKLNTFWSYSWPYYLDEDKQLQRRDEQQGWAAGVTVSVPLFSGMRNSTNYKKSTYAYMKAQVEQQQVENQFEVNLKRIRLFHAAAHGSVEAAGKQRELMDKNLEIMQKRYDGGLVNQSQLLEVSLGARMAKIGYIQRLFECLLYEAEYNRAIGKLEVTE